MMPRQTSDCVLSHLFKFPLTQLVIAGLVAMATSTPASAARPLNEYQVCASELSNAQVPTDQIPIACGEALKPEDLSRCVLRINLQTQVAGSDVLESCFRVRQPIQLANCVVRIDKNAPDKISPEQIIEYCRRSLRPETYSKCVSGLLRQLDITATKALDDCISAEDFPRELFPTFAPPPPPQPTPQLIPQPTPQLPPQTAPQQLPELTPAPVPNQGNQTTP